MSPNHVPTLELAGPLWLGLGELKQSSQVFDRTLSLFKSVELSFHKVTAVVGMGELSWLQGRLTAAMGWYNRAIELDPFSTSGWWGLAKVAMSARSGHPGADRAPWIRATPKRFTPEEGLARLLAGVLSPRSVRAWLQRTAMGRTLVEGGASPMRLACGVVDVMVRNEMVSPDLFKRLGDACPQWGEPIELVKELWLGDAATFPALRSYTWSSRLVEDEFDVMTERTNLPPVAGPAPLVLEDLQSSSAWEVLFADAQPPPPGAFVPPEELEARRREQFAGPIVALTQGDVLWGALLRDRRTFVIGTAEQADVRVPDDEGMAPEHAVLTRRGAAVYVAPAPGRAVLVNGERRQDWRLMSRDRLTVASTELEVSLHEDESLLPTEHRLPPGVPSPADVAALEALVEEEVNAERTVADPGVTPPSSDSAVDSVVDSAVDSVVDSVVDSAVETVTEPEPVAESVPDSLVEPVAAPTPTNQVNAIPISPVTATAEELAETPIVGSAGRVTPPPPAEPEQEDLEVVQAVEPASDALPPALTATGASPSVSDVVGLDEDSLSEVSQPAMEPMPLPEPVELAQEVPLERSEPVVEPASVTDPPPFDPRLGRGGNGAPEGSPFGGLATLSGSDSDQGAPPTPLSEDGVLDPFFSEFPESEEGEVPVITRLQPEDEDEGISHEGAPPVVEEARPPAWLKEALESERADDLLPAPSDAPPVLSPAPSPSVSPPASTTPAPAAPVQTPAPASPAILADLVDADEELTGTEEGAPPLPVAPAPASASATLTPAEPRPAPPPVRTVTPANGAERTGLMEGLVTGKAWLEFMSGPTRGQAVPIGPQLSVGQSEACGMSVPGDSRMSPNHCLVQRTATGFVLKDSGSATGTVVNGKRITELELQGGETIMVGRTVLRFRREA